jgi:hypothetical protein
VQADLDTLSCWLSVNKLAVNVKKTNYIIFKSPHRKSTGPVKIKFNGIELLQVHSEVFRCTFG